MYCVYIVCCVCIIVSILCVVCVLCLYCVFVCMVRLHLHVCLKLLLIFIITLYYVVHAAFHVINVNCIITKVV